MTRVAYSDGPGSPRLAPRDALTVAGRSPDGPVRVELGWTIETLLWLTDRDAELEIVTVLGGYGLADAIAAGRVTPLPVRLGTVGFRFRDAPPDVAVVAGVRRGDRLVFGTSVGWGPMLAVAADRVVVEVDPAGADLGGPEIAGNIVAVVERAADGQVPAATSRPADDIDVAIGRNVAAILPDDPALQFGPGGIGEGIARALDRPVRIWSGLVTDAMAELHDRDLLSEPAVAAYAWGGEPIRRLSEAGMLRMLPSSVVHDPGRLAELPRFVGCNTALQVGLDGSVNVESVGGREIAAVGGHADFCLGASRSPGGMSVIALRSTTRSGRSTIVGRVDVVSTPRSDIDVVVTEHGVADLRGAATPERARRLAAIASPEHRAALG